MKTQQTLIEQYISTKSFQNHKAKVINKLDKNKRYIDDVVQDFCEYYCLRPEKKPNIRLLYNRMINKIRDEKLHTTMDMNIILEIFENFPVYDNIDNEDDNDDNYLD